MKVRLYRKWVRYVLSEFPKHHMLKKPGGKYLLAMWIWKYAERFPYTNNWVTPLAEEFKREYRSRRLKRERK